MKNAVGRELPERVGSYEIHPYQGLGREQAYSGTVRTCRKVQRENSREPKLQKDLVSAIRAAGLRDGMTISFHHCFREGDYTVGLVLKAIQSLGIKGLRFAPSAVVNIQNCDLLEFLRDGTITAVEASGIRGALGDGLLSGEVTLAEPVILRPHGARPRAIEAGELQIDVAFLAASAADAWGNCTGQVGANPCGSLGYAFVDAQHAGKVIVITDTLVDYPCVPVSISQQYVDFVVTVPQIGDPAKIGAGAARLTKNPRDLMIAKMTAELICASSLFRNGFSFQTGVGAISIACTNYLAEKMRQRNITASFALGGITAAIIDMYDAGLVRAVACSQSFDGWARAMEFCRWLSGKTGKKVTLPTEAQWEYAARGDRKSTRLNSSH